MRFPGGLVRATPKVPTTSEASGIWTLREALNAKAQGIWPYPFGNDNFTVALLHMDGADAAATFPDTNRGGSAHTWTAAGNAQVDTAQSKFGGASLLMDGTGDFLSTPDHADFNFGSGEFTIDLWVRFTTLPTGTLSSGNGRIFASQWSTGSRSWIFGIGTTGAPNYQLSFTYNSTTFVGSNVSISTGVWYHMAAVRDNSGTDTLRLFLDGVDAGTSTGINGVTLADSTAACVIGAAADTFGANMSGWFDELRISKGVARWTGAFTPPTHQYAD